MCKKRSPYSHSTTLEEAERAHSDYINRVSEMRKISTKLDQNKEVSDKVVSDLKDNVEIEDKKISRKEIRRISKRISSIDNNIEAKKRSVTTLICNIPDEREAGIIIPQNEAISSKHYFSSANC